MRFVSGLVVILIVLLVFIIAADWKIFEKAGEPGWKALIPIYNIYIFYKISWTWPMFLVFIILSYVGKYMMDYMEGPLSMVGSIAILAATVVSAIQRYKLSNAFDKSIGFSVGMIFLPPIFSMILGFGNSEYKGITK